MTQNAMNHGNLNSIDLSWRPNPLFRYIDPTDFATQLNLRVRQDEALRWVRSNVRAGCNRISSIQRLKLQPAVTRSAGG